MSDQTQRQETISFIGLLRDALPALEAERHIVVRHMKLIDPKANALYTLALVVLELDEQIARLTKRLNDQESDGR